jgi:hypothetical protein
MDDEGGEFVIHDERFVILQELQTEAVFDNRIFCFIEAAIILDDLNLILSDL